MMWKAIKWCINNGFEKLSFGRTETENHGLLQFKRGWGAKEGFISYYKYDLAKDCYMADNDGIKSTYSIFKMLPLPILRMTGNLLYRHVG